MLVLYLYRTGIGRESTMATTTELSGYTEKLVLAAAEFSSAVAAKKVAKQAYDDAKVSAELAGRVYYDAQDTLDDFVGV